MRALIFDEFVQQTARQVGFGKVCFPNAPALPAPLDQILFRLTGKPLGQPLRRFLRLILRHRDDRIPVIHSGFKRQHAIIGDLHRDASHRQALEESNRIRAAAAWTENSP